MKREERDSYMMLFCGLLVAQSGKVTLEQTLQVMPLSGGAKRLAAELAR